MQQALSIQEACTAMCLGRTKLYQLISTGKLKAHKIGKRTIILKDDLDEFLNNLEHYPSSTLAD